MHHFCSSQFFAICTYSVLNKVSQHSPDMEGVHFFNSYMTNSVTLEHITSLMHSGKKNSVRKYVCDTLIAWKNHSNLAAAPTWNSKQSLVQSTLQYLTIPCLLKALPSATVMFCASMSKAVNPFSVLLQQIMSITEKDHFYLSSRSQTNQDLKQV